jgi:hypothetical protein
VRELGRTAGPSGLLRISCQALVVSVNLMRLSLEKAAYVVVFETSVVGNPEFARDDKGEGGDLF